MEMVKKHVYCLIFIFTFYMLLFVCALTHVVQQLLYTYAFFLLLQMRNPCNLWGPCYITLCIFL